MPGERVLFCEEHGARPWLGDVFCGRCGRVYLSNGGDVTPPDECLCGAQLLPRGGVSSFSARAACRSCAESQVANRADEQGGAT